MKKEELDKRELLESQLEQLKVYQAYIKGKLAADRIISPIFLGLICINLYNLQNVNSSLKFIYVSIIIYLATYNIGVIVNIDSLKNKLKELEFLEQNLENEINFYTLKKEL